MNNISLYEVRNALLHLSDYDMQHNLWLSDGSGGADVSSFTEAIEQLFTDTGLYIALEKNETGFNPEILALFQSMDREIGNVATQNGPLQTLDDPAMGRIMMIATNLLSLLPVA